MAYDERLAGRIRTMLADRSDVSERKMFGGLAFMVGGHMACGMLKDDLIVRVDPNSVAVALPFARPFDFTGRPTRGMAFVAPGGTASDDDLRAWIDRGLSSAERRRRQP